MTSNNMRGIVTFTIFSFLLLTITMFFVFSRYDVSYSESGTLIRIGFTMHSNENKSSSANGPKSHATAFEKDEKPFKFAVSPDSSIPFNKHKTLEEPASKFYEKFVAVMASRTHHSAVSTERPSSRAEDTTKTTITDDIDKLIAQSGSERTTATPMKIKSNVVPGQYSTKTTPKVLKYEDFNENVNADGSKFEPADRPGVIAGTTASSPSNSLMKPFTDIFGSIFTGTTPFKPKPNGEAQIQGSPVKLSGAPDPRRDWKPILFPLTADASFVDSSEKDATSLSSISQVPEFEILPEPQPEIEPVSFWPNIYVPAHLFSVKRGWPFGDESDELSTEDTDPFSDYEDMNDGENGKVLFRWFFPEE